MFRRTGTGPSAAQDHRLLGRPFGLLLKQSQLRIDLRTQDTRKRHHQHTQHRRRPGKNNIQCSRQAARRFRRAKSLGAVGNNGGGRGFCSPATFVVYPEHEASRSFGKGGQLFPDNTKRDLVWMNMEGKKFSFQASLCDIEEGRKRRFDHLESARWFDGEKLEYARMLADPDVTASEKLVMKRFISKRDQLPADDGFTPVATQHETTTGTLTSPTITVRRAGSGADVSADQPRFTSRERFGGREGQEAPESSRARWWSRSPAADQQEPSAAAAWTTANAIGVPDIPKAPTSASPTMGPTKTARASIDVPSASTISRPGAHSNIDVTRRDNKSLLLLVILQWQHHINLLPGDQLARDYIQARRIRK
ncbi:hypothetical protein FRC00_012935, partial [Tulasnella sp. 408]